MKIEAIHHVSLGVTDLERSRQFYHEILQLEEIARPPFNFPGAWFSAGASQQVHLIVHPNSTFRTGKGLDTRDGHFAVRVASYRQTVVYLWSRGYSEDAGRRAQTDDPAALCHRRDSRRSTFSTRTAT